MKYLNQGPYQRKQASEVQNLFTMINSIAAAIAVIAFHRFIKFGQGKYVCTKLCDENILLLPKSPISSEQGNL